MFKIKIFISVITFSLLIIGTSIIKNETREIEKKIFTLSKITNQKGLDLTSGSSLARFGFVSAQDMKNPKYAEALQLSNKITEYTEEFKNYAINRGLNFEEETNLRCRIIIDQSSSMYFPFEVTSNSDKYNKIHFSTVCAAALIHLLRRQRDAVGLSLFSENINLKPLNPYANSKLKWNTRVFDQRTRLTEYICEEPVFNTQRLGYQSRKIMSYLK